MGEKYTLPNQALQRYTHSCEIAKQQKNLAELTAYVILPRFSLAEIYK
jgi:hypothetical protein